AEDGIRDLTVTGVQTCALPILVRLLVVFHFLRQALGTQTAPSNQVLMGLALMMTWFLIQPVLLEVERTAVAPYSAGAIAGEQARSEERRVGKECRSRGSGDRYK